MRKYSMRIVTIFFIVLVISIMTYSLYKYVVPYLVVKSFVISGARKVQQRQIHLLCQTDYKILLDACMDVLGQVKTGQLKSGVYYLNDKKLTPNPINLPKPILDLNPTYVYIDEYNSGRMMLEMEGGLGHSGVNAYSEDFKKPSSDYVYGDRKLIEGLWYYDDGYRDNPKYNKVIDDLINKNKK
jgi:hypothetical protein